MALRVMHLFYGMLESFPWGETLPRTIEDAHYIIQQTMVGFYPIYELMNSTDIDVDHSSLRETGHPESRALSGITK
jgi:hypothetical protein